MRKKLKKMLKEKKGITLIALVITIIVLLILAGVSIAMLTGDNGILTQAQRAKEKTKIATDEEQRKLAMADATMNFENTTYQGITVPAGFAPTRIEGEDTIDDGLVIIDSEGNEFVWIPVGSYNEETGKYDTTIYEDAHTLSTSELWSKDTSYEGKSGWKDPENQIATGKTSIGKYGGFYVARYEAGVPTNATFYVEKNKEEKTYDNESKKNVTKENLIDLKPVSKKGNQVWNLISQENAVQLSKNMYKGSTSVSSYLIDSNAWNYICKYILKDKKHIDIIDSSTYGNYYDNITTNYEGIEGLFAKHPNSNEKVMAIKYEYGKVPSDYVPRSRGENTYELELATGICDDFKIYNIYDMAGNMWEWTTETVIDTDNKTYGVHRGGSFKGSGGTNRITRTAGGRETWFVNYDLGFRCVLYLK